MTDDKDLEKNFLPATSMTRTIADANTFAFSATFNDSEKIFLEWKDLNFYVPTKKK